MMALNRVQEDDERCYMPATGGPFLYPGELLRLSAVIMTSWLDQYCLLPSLSL